MNKYATTINNNVYSSKDGSPKTNSLKNELLVCISESFIELLNLIYQIIRILISQATKSLLYFITHKFFNP